MICKSQLKPRPNLGIYFNEVQRIPIIPHHHSGGFVLLHLVTAIIRNFIHIFDNVTKPFAIQHHLASVSLIARFTGPTWGPPGSCRPQVGPMWAPWTLLSAMIYRWEVSTTLINNSIIHRAMSIQRIWLPNDFCCTNSYYWNELIFCCRKQMNL